MDGAPRWGRGWISLGLWIGLESVLFLAVLAVGILGPPVVSALRSGGLFVQTDFRAVLDDGREISAPTREAYEEALREARPAKVKSVRFRKEPRWKLLTETGSGPGAWLALGPHVLGLGWVVAMERRRLLSRLRPSARSVGLGFAAGAAMIVVGGGWSWLLETAGVEIPDVAQTLRGLVPSQAILLLWGAALVPFVEEAWFRGRFLDAVRDRLDARWALLLTSVLFATVHGIAVFVPAYVAMAAILFALRERTGGLVAPIVAHAVNNAWGLLIPS